MNIENDQLLTTRKAMEFLGVNWSTIYGFISTGELKAHKLGGNGKSRRHWRIWHSDLIRFVNQDSENKGEQQTESLNKENEVRIY